MEEEKGTDVEGQIDVLNQANYRHTLALQILSGHILLFEKLLFTLLPKEAYQEYAARLIEISNLSAAAMMSPKSAEALRGAMKDILDTPFDFEKKEEEDEPQEEPKPDAVE